MGFYWNIPKHYLLLSILIWNIEVSSFIQRFWGHWSIHRRSHTNCSTLSGQNCPYSVQLNFLLKNSWMTSWIFYGAKSFEVLHNNNRHIMSRQKWYIEIKYLPFSYTETRLINFVYQKKDWALHGDIYGYLNLYLREKVSFIKWCKNVWKLDLWC